MQGFFFAYFPDECFPKDWLESSVPVLFDFQGDATSANPQDIIKNSLWCLLPGRAEGNAVVACISRNDLIARALSHSQLFNDSPDKFVHSFAENIRQQRRISEQQQANIAFRQLEQKYYNRYRRGRRRF